jgi:hypothetical protein
MTAPAVERISQRLQANPSRVITRLFVPGQEGFEHQESRAGAVLARILAMGEDEVLASLDDVITRFDGRHRKLACTFRRHAPAPSSLRFVLSVRGIGEGHRSSIGFRTGVIDVAGRPEVDQPAALATVGDTTPALLDAAVFHAELARLDDNGEAADLVFGALGDRFTRSDLDAQLNNLQNHLSTRGRAQQTIAEIRAIAQRTYAIEFPDGVPLSERVLWPAMPAEEAGMEDARFVRFVDDDGSVTVHASYTAYSGSRISQQLLTTTDFRSFTSTPMVGPAAANKGLSALPAPHQWPLRRAVARRPRIEGRRVLRPPPRVDRRSDMSAAF